MPLQSKRACLPPIRSHAGPVYVAGQSPWVSSDVWSLCFGVPSISALGIMCLITEGMGNARHGRANRGG